MKNRTWILILAAVLLLCAGAGAMLLLPGEPAQEAEIWLDGKLYTRVDLSKDQTLTIESQYGTNVVTVQDGKIGVTEADCPDHYCMQRGYCNSGAQIVCLPNKLVIQFVGKTEVDGAVG